ncbi:MAG TPA: FG-GAP-like repeat-containing protein, partial [Ideonella sp.]|nr:FG-GAP-like repeat-containing protein [Ideonella sp.]
MPFISLLSIPRPRPLLALAGLACCMGSAAAQSSAEVGVRNASVTLAPQYTTMPFTVVRRGDASEAVSFRYTTVDGSALAGTDYRPAAGIATIPAGSSSVALPVTVLGKAAGERQAGQFSLKLLGALATTGTLDTLALAPAGAGAVGSHIWGIATADFNGDGRTDLVLANYSAGTLEIAGNTTAAGAAAAKFKKAASLSNVSAPNKPLVCDLNNDGKPDIVATTSNMNQMSVHINTTAAGASSFSFQRNDVVSLPWGYMSQIACADFDGDGKLDLVGAGFGSLSAADTNRAIVFRNLTERGATLAAFASPVGFSAHAGSAFSAPQTVVSADFNGDGRPDIALGNTNTSDVTLLLNTTPAGSSELSFSSPVAFTTLEPGSDMAVLDINGDGRPDIVTTNSTGSGGATWALLMNGTAAGASVPRFKSNVRFIGGRPYGVAVADMDLDGRTDVLVTYLVTGDSPAGSVGVLLNRTPAGSDDPSFIVANS